ncbi:MAG: DNA polymerase III subunit epsilon [Candidatus Wallbacteria bacterium HGW-Wallbacteria-1]|jgi:DNA polymerase-3 subunit epsilon|uniref:DNA polymerase III subunit epsilon n=1 Tax=Candidatus Wallbacteria bacterium HGW-Wallbacteria-1 TaxID=2013854 RepID=A0A2N1PPM4_9BACT|nr:MAG: DNA polymerase III subunit epsilon [Candidatus Wallbacteria bacterium HGW-Wallbacteria-1]
MDRMAVIDFETTGLSPDMGDRAIEIAAVIVEKNRIVDRFQSLMNCGLAIPPFIQQLTGINNQMLEDAPKSSAVMKDFAGFAGNIPLIAHNASFDQKFLDAEWRRVGIKRRQPVICSMLLSRRVYQDSPNHKLGTLASFLNLPVCGNFHRAMADAEVTAHLMFRMAQDLRHRYGRMDLLDHVLLGHLQKIPKGEVGRFMMKKNSCSRDRTAL